MPITNTQSTESPRRVALHSEELLDACHRLAMESFDPNHFLDMLIVKMQLKSDTALASQLQVHGRIIEMLRSQKLDMSPAMLTMIQSTGRLSIRELEDLISEARTEEG